MIIGVPDTAVKEWLSDKAYVVASDEGEAVAIAAGRYLATGLTATVFMSADGFCNALNPLTSLIIPYEIPVNWVIGVRTDTPQHEVMGNTIEQLIELYGLSKIGDVKIIR